VFLTDAVSTVRSLLFVLALESLYSGESEANGRLSCATAVFTRPSQYDSGDHAGVEQAEHGDAVEFPTLSQLACGN
jgi:hypothetical protein